MTTKITHWLLNRGISQRVIEDADIHFKDDKIVIPVRDEYGNHIFDKKRRNPFKAEGPKYTYETGSIATLYNVHTVIGLINQDIFVTEGELDTLLLNSLDLNAVSSTGGAGMFKAIWADYLKDNNVYIVFDNDDAGIRGALKVQKMLPEAKIIFLPHDTKGKDVTDYFTTHSVEQFLALKQQAESWKLPTDPIIIPQKKAQIDRIIKSLNESASDLLERQRKATSEKKPTAHIEVMFEMIKNRKEYWENEREMIHLRKSSTGMEDVQRAKLEPISRYIKFNNSGFAKCLWHAESSPSMKWYRDTNHVYCYGCNARKDVIDVVMLQHGVSFKQALQLILGKPI